MTSLGSSSLLQRYRHAVQWLAPKYVSRSPQPTLGYWLDDNQYFFVAEKVEPSLGQVIPIASIANGASGLVEEVIPVDVLTALLADYSSQPMTLESLSTANFEMPDRDTLAVSVGGSEYLIDRLQRRVVQGRRSLTVPALYSPDGRYACFVQGYDLSLKDLSAGDERSLTTDGEEHYCYGQPSESNLAAVTYRRCPSPVGLWSPDSQWFLTHRIDERSLPDGALIQHAPPTGGRPILHRFKYPIPGDPLPTATYVAFHIPSGRMATFPEFQFPIALFSPFELRRIWFVGKDRVGFVSLDRYAKHVEVVVLDLADSTGRKVLRETVTSGYIDLNPCIVGTPNVRILPESHEVIWYSERDGWGHLYLYDASTGALKNQITRGAWSVKDIVQVDEAHRRLLFLGYGVDPQADPAQRSLCAVNLDGSGFAVLIRHDANVYVPPTEPCGLEQDRPYRPLSAQRGISPSGRFAVVQSMSIDRGDLTKIVSLTDRSEFTIALSLPAPDEPTACGFKALAADGVTTLHGAMFLPADFDERRRYPLIDYMYPGPQIAWQPQALHSLRSTQPRALAKLGFITVMIDTRGTPVGNRAFHQVGYGSLLEPQLADHAAVVRQLCERYSFIDGYRVGAFGQSGGGAAAVRALCEYGETFKVGVAVCGNHDANFYSANWSDKYRGPGDSIGWADQANGAIANKLRGKLLLISGDMDENVHLGQTLTLVDALIKANKDFDLLVVPNAGHGVLTTSGYAQRRVWDYFVRHLLDESPPLDFEIAYEPYELERFRKRAAQESR